MFSLDFTFIGYTANVRCIWTYHFNWLFGIHSFFFKSLFLVFQFFSHKNDIGLYLTDYIYTEKLNRLKYKKQQKKVNQRILSIGLHMELSDRLYLCCIKEI